MEAGKVSMLVTLHAWTIQGFAVIGPDHYSVATAGINLMSLH